MGERQLVGSLEGAVVILVGKIGIYLRTDGDDVWTSCNRSNSPYHAVTQLRSCARGLNEFCF